MKVEKVKKSVAPEVRMRLVEVGGRTSQDLGLGRIVGQILVYLYLQDHECSLDEICRDLGLSKAAVSVAARQLESLGFLRRVWRPGDRKSYYRTADNIATALQQGLMTMIHQKTQVVTAELEYVAEMLDRKKGRSDEDPDLKFLRGRVSRARKLGEYSSRLMSNPLLKLFVSK